MHSDPRHAEALGDDLLGFAEDVIEMGDPREKIFLAHRFSCPARAGSASHGRTPGRRPRFLHRSRRPFRRGAAPVKKPLAKACCELYQF
ncbi:hypothetical protein GCM10011335_11370 [Aureimonas glaciei]|uniref:Uncharacterized protein n=1 Tax=Aureimonas glaciei TaxID=1776957 RepID=A0A916XTQ5_9HYPH|nr:hypothetical protein GCM10011335_11370 [Aureimonas glaciei]